MRQKIAAALAHIEPALHIDGGDVEFVGFKEGTVAVRLTGGCRACSVVAVTLQSGIERYLKQQVPGVKEVVSV